MAGDIQNHEDEYDDPIDRDDDDDLDEGVVSSGDNHDNEPGDERLVTDSESTEEEKEREQIRARRREQRQRKKEVQKAKEHVFRSELAARDQMIEQLTQRLTAIEQKGAVGDVAQVDAELNRLAAEYNNAKAYLKKGTDEQNGELVANATERMQQIRNRAEQLAAHKQRMEQSRQIAQTQPQVDPRLKTYADRWVENNKWFDSNGRDRESSTVKAIDASMANEGWNPNTAEYWDELTERVKVALPHRFKTDYTPEKRPTSSPVSGSSRTSASSKPSATYNLSPERVTAMKEAGVWDDPKKRAAMIEAYKRYDKENKVA
jgi:chemotaxis protein histidine kinase CheA